VKYLVHPSKIRSGGPPPDGIPSIDEPRFVSVSDASKWIAGNELVMSLVYKGVRRVYPIQVMVWHEIVNDTVCVVRFSPNDSSLWELSWTYGPWLMALTACSCT